MADERPLTDYDLADLAQERDSLMRIMSNLTKHQRDRLFVVERLLDSLQQRGSHFVRLVSIPARV